jgi:hypothetical protein
MDSREILRLKTQVLSTRIRLLKGRPMKRHARLLVDSAGYLPISSSSYFGKMAMKGFDNYESRIDDGSMCNEDDANSFNSSLLALNVHRSSSGHMLRRYVPRRDVTARSLLVVSIQNMSSRQSNKKSKRWTAEGRQNSRGSDTHTNIGSIVREEFPTEAFLAGCLWFGKNLAVTIERLHDDVSEISAQISSDLSMLEHDEDQAPDDNHATELTTLIKDGLRELADTSSKSVTRAKRYLHVYNLNLCT